jgi:hypothetical protein
VMTASRNAKPSTRPRTRDRHGRFMETGRAI